jgi:hypothetical protein
VTTEERHLSDWLQAETPEPPRRVSVDDIASRAGLVDHTPAYRRWVPMLAAACVVLVVVAIALIISVNRPDRSQPIAPPTSPVTTSVTTSSRPPLSPSATDLPLVPAGTVVGPWGASTVGGAAAHDRPLAGDMDSLYVNDGKAILRLDAANGNVLAKRSYPTGAPIQALIAADALWVASETGSDAMMTVRGLDLNTLAPIATVTVHLPGATPAREIPAFEANVQDDRLFLGVDNTITVIDATTREVIQQYRGTGGLIADLAVNPDDTRLYVTTNMPNAVSFSLAVLNPLTGAAISRTIHVHYGTGFEGIAASAGGIWLQTGAGMTNRLNFRPAPDLTKTGGAGTSGGGGYPVTSTVAANVVWLGGTRNLACADPITGKVRASVAVPTPHRNAANIAHIVAAGTHLFAYYQAAADPAPLLIRLSPPAQCAN